MGEKQADTTRNSLFVAAVDGSSVTKIYTPEDRILRSRFAWAPSGDAIYIASDDLRPGNILLIPADGSGRVIDLGGTDKDSVLTPVQQAEFKVAARDLQAAAQQARVGEEGRFLGHIAQARPAYRRSADLLGGLLWEAPHLHFSAQQVLGCTQSAIAEANRSDSDVLSAVCKERLAARGWLSSDLAVRLASERPNARPGVVPIVCAEAG